MAEEIDPKVLEVAKAINGPWNHYGHLSREKLLEVREVKWGMLTTAEKNGRICEARAAIAALS